MSEPFYDPVQDKIYGCKKNTLMWWHEKGHQFWYKKGIEQELQTWEFICILLCIAGLSILSKNVVLIIAGLIPVGLLTVSEIHAWIYAFKMRFGKIKK